MSGISLLGKEFVLFLSEDKIQARIQGMADRMNEELKNEDIVFVGILNGAFMFASDLLRRISFDARVTFVKLFSYPDIRSTGAVLSLVGINEDLTDKTVVIVEDIVDTGNTIETIIAQIRAFKPRRILIAALLLKPEKYKSRFKINYVGFRISNNFIIGYGLDYQGYGRNLRNLYVLEE
jgi:hypoxanthine phosphoribosyltransferase